VREPVTRLISDFTQITKNREERGLPVKGFDESIGRAFTENDLKCSFLSGEKFHYSKFFHFNLNPLNFLKK
jgi:hypothetical protein